MKLSESGDLYLMVTPVGSKLWCWKYRIGCVEKAMALDAYPQVTLAQAREAMAKARKLLAVGDDPMAQRKADKRAKLTAAENSFLTVALLWWEQWRSGVIPRHADDVHKHLKADVFPAIGKRPVSDIEAPELMAMVKAIAARGALDIAKRALQTSGQVFGYAIDHGLAQRNPATDIKPADILTSRKAGSYARLAQYKGDNNGNLTLAWSIVSKRGWKSRTTLWRCKSELIETGFVCVTRKGLMPSTCELLALTWFPLDVSPKLDEGALHGFVAKTYARTTPQPMPTVKPKTDWTLPNGGIAAHDKTQSFVHG